MSTTTDTVGTKIKKFRMSKFMSQADLADAINCSRSIISMIENDARLPSASTLEGIIKVLNLKEEDIFDDNEKSFIIQNIYYKLVSNIPVKNLYKIYYYIDKIAKAS